jgi:signal recognition particle subunit SRP54
MFDQLQNSLAKIVRSLRGEGKITPDNIADTLRQIRRALLEADVNYKVVKDFIQEVQNKAIGVTVTKSLTPGQVMVKIIHDELTRILGQTNVSLSKAAIPPTIIMLVGLQGTGKTTTAAKLAYFLRSRKRESLLVPLDLKRPAAEEQLKQLGKQYNLPVFSTGDNLLERANGAFIYARQNHFDTLILDTAGRLHIDADLMTELKELQAHQKPQNTVLVADGMTGQDAINTARAFNEELHLDGIILTKMDSDARGGAALSIVAVTGKPILFLGTGEKVTDLESFHPERIAGRILGMGDIVSLVEKVQSQVAVEEAQQLAQKLVSNRFDLEDYLAQLRQLKKMGPIENILSSLPGLARFSNKITAVDNRELVKTEAIIQSMTPAERRNPTIINGSRRRRIAMGSGTTATDVNRVLNQYWQIVKLSRQFNKMRIPKNLASLGLG